MTSHREQLESLRDVLWSSIQEVDPDKRAPLANQYRAVLQELEALSAANAKAGDPVDEIAARRSARGGATARADRAAGRTR